MNLSQRIQVIERRLLHDARGALLKALKGDEPNLPAVVGEIYVVWAEPGQSRGGHFHLKTAEWFTLLEGECRLTLADPNENERLELVLNMERPQTVFVPAGIAHRFDNLSQSRWLLLAFASRPYDASDTVIFDCG